MKRWVFFRRISAWKEGGGGRRREEEGGR